LGDDIKLGRFKLNFTADAESAEKNSLQNFLPVLRALGVSYVEGKYVEIVINA